jgi:hypothetical protein
MECSMSQHGRKRSEMQMLRGGAEYQRQRVLDRVSAHWPVIQMDVCDCGGERHFPPPSPGTSNLQPVLRHAGVVSVKIG